MGFNRDSAAEAASYAQAAAYDARDSANRTEKKLHDFICLFCAYKDKSGKCTAERCRDNNLFTMKEDA